MSAFALAADVTAPSFERPVDLVHLARQTLGDRALEREVLSLFKVQTKVIIAQLHEIGDEKMRYDLAHTLKGSARAVGAWKVAEAAEACERASADKAAQWQEALADLAGRIETALAAIEDFIRN
ncbi:Hpt domain-containing protein [Rhabdaerophilum sp.]|uniref:Hpt domain-containing protein n=1 Tax=Rhabdaerophilum sp. TaxID=2717341 RepID=UPI0038D3DC39